MLIWFEWCCLWERSVGFLCSGLFLMLNLSFFFCQALNSPEVQHHISRKNVRGMETRRSSAQSWTTESSLTSSAVKELFFKSLRQFTLITNSSLLRYVSCIIIRLHVQTGTGLRRGLWSMTPNGEEAALSVFPYKQPDKFKKKKTPQDLKLEMSFFLFRTLFPSI